jgi:long-chain acyl-CoA synthetase
MHPLLDRLEGNCRAGPDRRAVCDRSLILDYQGLRALACGLAGQIEKQTARPRVGVLAPASAAGAAAILACWYAGKIPVPLNFFLNVAELSKIIRDADLDLVLTGPHFDQTAQAVGLKSIVLGAPSRVPGDRPAPPAAPDDVAVALYTSGTSGDPKGVCLSFNNLVQNARACVEYARIEPTHTFLSVLPQFHSFGFTAMTIAPLLLGAAVYYLPRFSPLALVEAVAEKGISVLMAVPSMYAALANLKHASREMFASVKLAVSGGEPLPEKVYDMFQRRFGVTLYEGYGLTETSPVVALNTPWAHRRGSVGRPIPGAAVAAVDAEGRELPPGVDGELIIRGHCVMRGYLNRPEATAAAIRNGALWTGDIGHVDADGFVWITGRAREMIIVGGENVFPREIENVLLEHHAVREAAVIGVRDEIRGELPAAYVILKEGQTATETELREFCRQRLAGYKTPRWVRFAGEVLRSPTGKILKRLLASGA